MIYVECEADKILVQYLGILRKEIKHAGNKGNVCNKLKKNKNSKALIDQDPFSNQPYYIQKLKIIFNEYNIKVLFDNEFKNYLIILCPRLEKWILQVANNAGIDIKKYGFPTNDNKLHKMINSNIKKFKELVNLLPKDNIMLTTLSKYLHS